MLRLTERISLSKVATAPAAASSSQHFSDNSVAMSVGSTPRSMPFILSKSWTPYYAETRCSKLIPSVSHVCKMPLTLLILRSSDIAETSLFIKRLLSSTFAADFCILNRKSSSWPFASFRARYPFQYDCQR